MQLLVRSGQRRCSNSSARSPFLPISELISSSSSFDSSPVVISSVKVQCQFVCFVCTLNKFFRMRPPPKWDETRGRKRCSCDWISLQVSIYDSTDRLLSDSDRLKDFSISSNSHLALRFTLMNTITSLGHCVCASSSSSTSSSFASSSSSSSTPTVIQRETINRTLSTCPLVPTPPHSPRSSVSPIRDESPVSIVNLLTPPSPPTQNSSFLIENLVESSSTDPSLIDQITSEFGEICPTIKPKRQRLVKKSLPKSFSSDFPLDLTMKKRPSSFDLFSTQSKWLKMIWNCSSVCVHKERFVCSFHLTVCVISWCFYCL